MRPREQSQQDEQPLAVDSNLFFDRVTLGIIRHPVVASDGGVYEASSYLDILQRAGNSLVNPALPLTSAVYVPAIQNTIDSLFGDHPDRPEVYNFREVMDAIQQHFNHQAARETGVALFLYSGLELMHAGALSTACLSGMVLLMLCIPGVQLFPIFFYSFLCDERQSLASSIDALCAILPNIILPSMAVAGVSQIGLFAGRKAGYFPAEEREEPQFRMD